ncbi:hypothetical protein DFJ69_2154 [Thermomonospora umbrina]|uniref:Uncharacterized protein n=1 Tax=Thermomonospora umbrina TaxID=111806 RepID=A0A3D9SLV5_9ACTN|nr:hypothetical protein DFJ69_2154 [Thermomonospora umbrina]
MPDDHDLTMIAMTHHALRRDLRHLTDAGRDGLPGSPRPRTSPERDFGSRT